ncbi:MAG: bifunctional 5,10-methylenetetrahydrofolate dehydrogenase/5,10-methenyltetrahydrofolate cyclohydrolase [Bullifex sp.]
MSTIIDGKKVSLAFRERIKSETEELKKSYNRVPRLDVILVGSDPASQTYVAAKAKAAAELGFDHHDHFLPEETTEEELISLVEELNANDNVSGILVQLPLPSHISEDRVINTIDVKKDVDGFTPESTGLLAIGEDCLAPCTPRGIMELFKYYKIETRGRKVAVLGRSNIVGKPIALMLMQKGIDATVTVLNSHTPDIREFTLNADIIIAAVGIPFYLKGDMVRNGAVVIDVGINRIPDSSKKKGYRVVGDTAYDELKYKCSYITPVPGGVGPMTITMLMANTLKAFRATLEEA